MNSGMLWVLCRPPLSSTIHSGGVVTGPMFGRGDPRVSSSQKSVLGNQSAFGGQAWRQLRWRGRWRQLAAPRMPRRSRSLLPHLFWTVSIPLLLW